MFIHWIRNGKHGTAEEQVEKDKPAPQGPVDAPKDVSKENVSPAMESDELEDNGYVTEHIYRLESLAYLSAFYNLFT